MFKIIVPVDGSKQAESAFSLACSLANFRDAEIILMQVVEYPFEIYAGDVNSRTYPNPHMDPKLDKKIETKKETIQSRVEVYLECLAESVKDSQRKVSIEIREGPVVNAILKAIDELEINMIVMSSTGKDQNNLMMGSIASRILREAQLPVILMRDEPGNPTQSNSSGRKHPPERTINNHYDFLMT